MCCTSAEWLCLQSLCHINTGEGNALIEQKGRYLMYISQQNHVDHILKWRFRSKNLFISHIAKICFKNVRTISSYTVSKILNEYCVDFIKLDTPHGIKDEMALQYKKTLSDCIKGENWYDYRDFRLH